MGRQRATRQQEANFTLNRWIQAAKINSKVKLMLGLRKSAMPSRVPGPEQALSKHLLANEMNGRETGERQERIRMEGAKPFLGVGTAAAPVMSL